MRILIGILIGILSILILAALTPAMQDLMSTTRNADSFNCKTYIDPNGDVTLNYNSTLETNMLGCQVSGFGIGIVVLSILIGIIMFVLYGSPQQERGTLYQQQY